MMEAEVTRYCGTVFTQIKRGRTKDSEWKGVDLNKTQRNVYPLPAPGGKPMPMPGMPWGRPGKEKRLAPKLHVSEAAFPILKINITWNNESSEA